MAMSKVDASGSAEPLPASGGKVDDPPPHTHDASARQLRRGLFALAGVLALLMVAALTLARLQEPTRTPWDDDPPRWSWAWFTEPLEFDRWLRPGSAAEAPRLRSLAVVSPGEGAAPALFATGEKGVLLRSADAGRTWTARRVAGAGRLAAVAVGAPGAWLVLDGAGAVWRSEDGGRSWSPSLPSGSGLRALAYAPDGRTLLAVGRGTVMRSDNHGRDWRTLAGTAARANAVPRAQAAKIAENFGKGYPQQMQVPPEKYQPPPPPAAPPEPRLPQLDALVFTGPQSALAAHADGLLRTTNGGQAWTPVALGAIAPAPVKGLVRDGSTVLAWGDAGLLRSADAGASWRVVYADASPVRSVSLAPGGRTGLAVREDGTVLRTQDGGQSWTRFGKGPAARLESVATVDGLAAIGTDLRGAVLRADGGKDLWLPAAGYARYPAPWFTGLAGFLMLPPVGAGALAWRRRKAKLARRGLLDNGVSDEPIARAEQDRLAFGPAVEALASFLRHSATTPPLAIAINAPWGMGKTSFMRMLVSRLRQLGARPVWFNVWHHQHEEVLVAPLLQAITRQAIPSWWQWQGWRFRARLVLRRLRKLNSWGAVASLAGLLTIPLYLACLALRAPGHAAQAPQFPMLDHFVRDLHSVWNLLLGGEWLAAAKSASFTEVLAAAFGALRSDPANGYRLAATVIVFICLYLLSTWLLRPFPTSPAILAARLNSKFSLSQAEAKADFRQRFREHFGDVAHALAPRTLTLFIDDLDRCEPHKAAELLEAVNYLCEAGPCYVVLGMARELVEAQVASAHKALAEEQAVLDRARGAAPRAPDMGAEQDRLVYARKYLRKLVQLDVQLPTVDATQALHLLLQKHHAREDAHPAAHARRQRVREIGGALFMPLTLLLAAGLFVAALLVQWQETLGAMEEEARAERTERLASLARVDTFLREARRLEQALRLQADPQRASGMQLAGLRSDADVIAAHIRAVEAAVPLLQKETGAFDKLLASAVAPHESAVQKLRQEYAGSAGDNDVVAAIARQAQPRAAARAPEAGAAPAADVNASSAPGATPLPAGDQPNWPYALATLPVLLLAIAAFTYRDRYVVEPTRAYEEAVAAWQPQLLANRETGSPRELKRFMNVSRYVVARGQARDPLRPDVPESTIVEFSARWLLARAQGVRTSPEMLARADSASPQQVPERERQARWFLQVVGDISG